jgi:hypothetical protein
MSESSGIDRAFEAHDAFESQESGFAATATPFEATATYGEDPPTVDVVVRLPTIDAVADGEVGEATAEGWYETLSLRLEDAYDVTQEADGTLDVDREGETVRVEYTYAVDGVATGVDDAAAIVDYVEGTYVQGVIPGYEYGDPVAELVADARRNAQGR